MECDLISLCFPTSGQEDKEVIATKHLKNELSDREERVRWIERTPVLIICSS